MSRKHVVYNTLGASLLLTGTIVWLAGVDVPEAALAQSRVLADAIEGAMLHPVSLPVWAIALLCIPTIWLAGRIAQAVTRTLQRISDAWAARRLRPRRPRKPAAREALAREADAAPAEADAASSEPTTCATRPEDYCEDAVHGVVWRWQEELHADALSAHCAACDQTLVPWANGGSLSRGLHCERCNKLRAAGEHPDEVFGNVAETLTERRRTGAWRNASRRVEDARAAGKRPLRSLPAA